jgi:hypothetical protein
LKRYGVWNNPNQPKRQKYQRHQNSSASSSSSESSSGDELEVKQIVPVEEKDILMEPLPQEHFGHLDDRMFLESESDSETVLGQWWHANVTDTSSITRSNLTELLSLLQSTKSLSNAAVEFVVNVIVILLPEEDAVQIHSFRKIMNKAVSVCNLRVDSFDICVNQCDNGAFSRERADLNECPDCKEPRYHEVKGKVVPRGKIQRRISLSAQVQQLLEDPVTSPYLRMSEAQVRESAAEHAEGFSDVHCSPLFRRRRLKVGDIPLSGYTDGIRVFKGMRGSGYSMWLTLFECLLLPWHLRTNPKYMIIVDIIPGFSQSLSFFRALARSQFAIDSISLSSL